MRGAAGEIGVVQVIGLDPHRHETAEQGLEHRRIVIDPAQQHGLRQHRDAGADQPGNRLLGRRGQLARMVGVDHDIDRLFRGQRRNQRRRYPAGIDYRDAGVKAYHAEMRNCVEGAHDPGEAARRQHQRVAAGDDDLPDLGPLADIGEGAVERRRLQHRRRLADGLAAKAEAAIDRTQQGRLQQYPVGIAMDDAGHRRPARVADRIGQFLAGDGKLSGARHELRRDRIGRVGADRSAPPCLRSRRRELLRPPCGSPRADRARRDRAETRSLPRRVKSSPDRRHRFIRSPYPR